MILLTFGKHFSFNISYYVLQRMYYILLKKKRKLLRKLFEIRKYQIVGNNSIYPIKICIFHIYFLYL